ncbi:hypothetical protein [Salmonella phage SD-6_S16]|nr:hypothetical protein [Salmonella phage SD-6_S16]
MNIEQYYIDALPTRESLLYTQNTFIHYKRCPKLLNSYRSNIIRNALQGAESMQYYYILALLIEY